MMYPCYRLDPVTFERLEVVTKDNLKRTKSWEDLRKEKADEEVQVGRQV